MGRNPEGGGRIYAIETDKAFDAVPDEFDWCIYIQADEVIHEKDYPAIKKAMQKWLNYPDVEGFLFRYHHFFGSYDYVGDSRKWYRNEIRIIRNNKAIRSYRDAQGFRKKEKNYQLSRLMPAFTIMAGYAHPL